MSMHPMAPLLPQRMSSGGWPAALACTARTARTVCAGLLAAACAFAPPARAQAVSTDVQAAPALPYSGAVARRFADPDLRYRTPGLAHGRHTFTSNAELAQALQDLVQRPQAPGRGPQPRLLTLGRSQLGQPILALHFSSSAAKSPPGDRPQPAALFLAQQHGNEPAGAEALLVLAQQLAGGEFNAVLQQMDVVLLPRANPDAVLMAGRGTASGHDMNRDHLLLHTPEARAVAALVQQLQPLLVVDLHEYNAVGDWLPHFGAEARHDLLVQGATTAQLDPAWQALTSEALIQPLMQALAEHGLRGEAYHADFSQKTPGGLMRRLRMGSVQPDVARNVLGLRHAASLLLESRGIGIGHTHIQRRVHSHVVALHALLQAAAQQLPALQLQRERSRADAIAQACRGEMTVLGAHREGQRELLFLEPATGADKLLLVPWEDALQRVDVIRRARPCGYWLAADATEAVHRLQLMGLQVQRLDQAVALQAQAWVEKPRAPDAEPAPPALAGRLRRADVLLQAQTLQAPAGSWWLPLSQPLAALAVAALEPDTPSSYFANRLLPLLTSAARVMAPP